MVERGGRRREYPQRGRSWGRWRSGEHCCCRIRRPPPHAPRVRAPTGIPRRLDRDPVPWQARRRRPPVQGARQQHGGSLYDLARTPHPANGTPYMTDSPLPHALALAARGYPVFPVIEDGKLTATKGRSEEHKSELQSLMSISSAVFLLKKKHTCTKRGQD